MNKASICLWYLFCFIFFNYDDKICIIKISKDFPILTKFLIISSSILWKYSGACRKREHLCGKQGTFEKSRFYEKDLSLYFRSSRLQMFYKIQFIENFTKFTRKRLCRSLFFIQVARLKLQVFQKRCRYFPVSLMKLLRTLFLQSNCGRLLLILAFKESDKLKMCMDVRENLQTRHAKEVRICPCLPFRQKQPFADVLQNRCSYKFRNIHMKTPVLEPLFNKVAGLKAKQNLI